MMSKKIKNEKYLSVFYDKLSLKIIRLFKVIRNQTEILPKIYIKKFIDPSPTINFVLN